MDKANPGREARLKLVAADHYPTLPVSRWTPAGPLSRLVADWLRHERPGESVADRPLLDADFEFRGGAVTPAEQQTVLPPPLRVLQPS